MTDSVDPIVDHATGMATVQNGAVLIGGRKVEEILVPFIGLEVKLIIAHKPNPDEKPPPFLWMIQEQGELVRSGTDWWVGDKPFNLNLLPGYNSVLSIVNMGFKVADPVEMTGANDFRAQEKADILATEKRLREAMGRLSGVLGDMIGEKK